MSQDIYEETTKIAEALHKNHESSKSKFMANVEAIESPWFSEKAERIAERVNKINSIMQSGMHGRLNVDDIDRWIARIKELQMEIKVLLKETRLERISLTGEDSEVWIQGIWIDSDGQSHEITIGEAYADDFMGNTLPDEIEIDGHTYRLVE